MSADTTEVSARPVSDLAPKRDPQPSTIQITPIASANLQSGRSVVPSVDELTEILAHARRDAGGGPQAPVDAPCPAGFQLTVYNGDVSKHYTLASENVRITKGSVKYVEHHCMYGPQMRYRFQLCNNYLQKKCPKLSECSYIHATALTTSTDTHLNPFAPRRNITDRPTSSTQDNPAIAEAYETMAPGFFVPLFPPAPPKHGALGAAGDISGDPTAGTGDPLLGNRVSATAAIVVVPTERIIRTKGSDLLHHLLTELAPALGDSLRSPNSALAMSQNPPPALTNRARHCAHFQFKRVCNLGQNCQYIHSKVPLLSSQRAAEQQQQHHHQHHHQHQHQHQQFQQQLQPQPIVSVHSSLSPPPSAGPALLQPMMYVPSTAPRLAQSMPPPPYFGGATSGMHVMYSPQHTFLAPQTAAAFWPGVTHAPPAAYPAALPPPPPGYPLPPYGANSPTPGASAVSGAAFMPQSLLSHVTTQPIFPSSRHPQSFVAYLPPG
jgi:hypothetical protein